MGIYGLDICFLKIRKMEGKYILVGEEMSEGRNTIKVEIWYFKEISQWKEAERIL